MIDQDGGRLYTLQVFATGGLILSLALVLTVLTLFSVLGPFRFLEQPPHRDRVLGG